VAPVPTGAATGPVIVTVNGQISNGLTFTVTNPGPSITSLSLPQGPVNMGFVINGANFGSSQGSSTVKINGAQVPQSSILSWGANAITVQVPTNATSGPVVVTVGGQASNGMQFTLLAAFNCN